MNARALALIGVMGVGAFLLYTKFMGGSVSATSPTNVPQVAVPDANTAADGVSDGAAAASDYIAGLTPATWGVITVVALTGLIIWLFTKYTALRFIAVGVAVAVVGSMVISGIIGR